MNFDSFWDLVAKVTNKALISLNTVFYQKSTDNLSSSNEWAFSEIQTQLFEKQVPGKFSSSFRIIATI